MPAPPEGDGDPHAFARGRRLESWKEIAGYLNRHVTTIRRWEKHEGLPVHRHRHAKLGSIYAYTRELDSWFESRRQGADHLDAPIAAPPGVSDRLPPHPSLTTCLSDTLPLTGRDEEIDILRARWELASRGGQQIVVVTGEPGVGKTRLVLEFAAAVARQSTVLIGQCDREAIVAYAPWVAILQWMVRTTPVQALRRYLAGLDGVNELAHIVPEFTTRIHVTHAPESATPDGRRYRLFEATSQLLAAASRSAPILLVLDDLHWADQGSLLLLRHLIRSTRTAAICVVIIHRNDVPEWSPEFRDVVESLRRDYVPTRIGLHRLADDHVCAMIEDWLDRAAPPSLTRLVVRHTEGNPLFVVELLKHLKDVGGLAVRDDADRSLTLADVGLPDGIRQLIGRRLERLDATTRRLLTIASVMGREFRLSVIESMVDVGEDGVLDAMDEAVTAGIVSEDAGAPGNFSFTHTLIREVLYTSITAARRVRVHHRMAGAIEQQSSAIESRLSELAYHFGQASVYKSADKAVEYGTRAGDYAAGHFAFESAAHWYETALRAMNCIQADTEQSGQRFDLYVKRGRSFFAVGQWASARNAYEAAVSLLDPSEHDKRAELLVRLAETAFWLMDVPALRNFASEAQTLADRVSRDDLWGEAQAWLASAAVADGDVPGAIRMDRQALKRARGIHSFGLARTPLTLYWAGRVDEAIERGIQAVESARDAEDPSFLLYSLQHLALSLSGAGRYDESLRVFDEACALGKSCGALPLLARATSMSVAPLLSLGDLDAAMQRALEARDIAHRVAFEPPLISAGIDLLLIHARRGDPGPADQLLAEIAEAVQKATGWHAWKWEMRLAQAQAELAFARGAWDDSRRAATRVIERSQARHRPKYEALGLVTRARAAARLTRPSAVKDARAAVKVARRLRDPSVLLDCLVTLLGIDGTDAVLEEAGRTAQALTQAVSDVRLRSTFLTSLAAKAPLLRADSI